MSTSSDRDLKPFEDITPDRSIAARLGKNRLELFRLPRSSGNVHQHVALNRPNITEWD